MVTKFLEIWPTVDNFMYHEPKWDRIKIMTELKIGKAKQLQVEDMAVEYKIMYRIVKGDIKRMKVSILTRCGMYEEDVWKLLIQKVPCSPRNEKLRQYAEREGLLNG